MIDTVSIRNSILRLAFSGNLTERTDTDDRVEDLLSRVNPKKSIAQDEGLPYEIPSEWAKVKLVDLYKINPRVEADENEEAAFIPMEKISPGYNDDFTFETQSWGQASKNHTKFQNGDVAFAKISPCFENRKSFVARDLPNGIGGGTTELIILRQKEMLPEYTYYLVLDQRFINTGSASYKGTVGQQRIQSDVVKNYVVPVPPVEEQKRIVKKISEAFSILDRIDALQEEYASNQETLKSKLFDVAIQGKLTEQLPEDGTAEDLYNTICEEKKNLINEGKLKKAKPLSVIQDEEIPFEIPDNWIWVRLSDVIDVRDGTHDSPKYHDEGIPLVTSKNISSGELSFDDVKLISEADANKINERSYVDDGDILFAMIGSIGNPVIVHKDREFCIKNVALFKNFAPSCISMQYVYWYLMHEQYVLRKNAIGGLQPFVSLKVFRNHLMPLPPFDEQERISNRLYELIHIVSEK